MPENNWYIITKDKEGFSGLWRKVTKDPTYQEFGADMTTLPSTADFEKDIAPLVKTLNGKNKASFTVQAEDPDSAIQAAYVRQFINSGQRSSLLAKQNTPAPQPKKNSHPRP